MPEIKITVKNKIATGDGTVIICGNSDYSVKFTFDAEWQSQTTKTMRVIYGDNKYYDVVFTGNTANMPSITNSIGIKIGCYAGNLETSTPAYFDAKKSILCDNPIHTTPPTDVYNQLVSRINDIEDDIEDIEEDKQDKLTAGQNITIVNNVISATGGSSGTTDHTQLTNRDASNQHPISSITGLQAALDAKADDDDIEDIEEVLEMGAPNYVDSIDEMTDTSKDYVLRSNNHIYKYGKTSERTSAPTNYFIEANATYNSSVSTTNGSVVSATNYVVTDYIAVVPGDVIRFEGICMFPSEFDATDLNQAEYDHLNITAYDSSHNYLNVYTNYLTSGVGVMTRVKDSTYHRYKEITIANVSDIAYIRISGAYIHNKLLAPYISKNEEFNIVPVNKTIAGRMYGSSEYRINLYDSLSDTTKLKMTYNDDDILGDAENVLPNYGTKGYGTKWTSATAFGNATTTTAINNVSYITYDSNITYIVGGIVFAPATKGTPSIYFVNGDTAVKTRNVNGYWEITYVVTTVSIYDFYDTGSVYVPGGNAIGRIDSTISGIRSDVNQNSADIEAIEEILGDSIEAFNGGESVIKNKLSQLAKGYVGSRDSGSNGKKTFKLLHFTDTHGCSDNVERLIEFYNKYNDLTLKDGQKYIDAICCTGDIVTSNYGSNFSWWSAVGADFIPFCLGNHEAMPGSTGCETESNPVYPTEVATKLLCYTRYYADRIDDWDVTQPENAATDGLCYFYKDFDNTDYKIRMIYIDVCHETNAQLTWFTNALADAKTNNYQVIVCSHYQPAKHNKAYNEFQSIEHGGASSNYPVVGFVQAVDTFQTNGGTFICWITGHTHEDDVASLQDYPNQLDINCADEANWSSGDRYAEDGLPSQESFNVIGIDAYSKIIRIVKFGRTYDRYMQHIDTMCYDYNNHKILYPRDALGQIAELREALEALLGGDTE